MKGRSVPTKKCSKCDLQKHFSEFSRCSARKDGLQNYCKFCASKKTKTWQISNSEKYQNLVKTWRMFNNDKIVAARKAYAESNREKLKVYSRPYKKAWRDKNKALISIYTACRRGRMSRQKIRLSPEMMNAIKDFYIDAKIISEVTGIPHHVDHIVPLQGKSCSGLHVPWNLRIIPASVNLSKGNRMPCESEHIALSLVNY